MNNLKELRKLVTISLIVFGIGLLQSLGYVFIFVGLYLLIEHIWLYEKFSFWDFLGHENIGLLFIIIGFCIIGNITGIVLTLIGYLISCDFSWNQELTPAQYAKRKLRLW